MDHFGMNVPHPHVFSAWSGLVISSHDFAHFHRAPPGSPSPSPGWISGGTAQSKISPGHGSHGTVETQGNRWKLQIIHPPVVESGPGPVELFGVADFPGFLPTEFPGFLLIATALCVPGSRG